MFAKVFTAATILAAVAQSAFAKDCNRKYTIKEGDICDSISAANNVSTYQLATINAGYIDTECKNLQPNAEICLGYGDEDCSTTYVVKSGDTGEIISGATGVNTTLISLNNPQILPDWSNVYVGEVLCVADSVIIPPAAGVVATAVPTTAAPASTPQPTTESWDEGDDDEDIPYCDEI